MEYDMTEVFNQVLSFVQDREKDTGGFGATPKLPATIEDTYHALRIIHSLQNSAGSRLIDKDVTQRHGEFLRQYLRNDTELTTKGMYQLLWCLRFCSMLPSPVHIEQELRQRGYRPDNREKLYFLVKIQELIKGQQEDFTLDLPKEPGLYPFTGILLARWMSIYIDTKLETNIIDHQLAIDWIRRCQNPDGGFGFMPGTTSYLENCHFALGALRFLNQRCLDEENGLRFVMGCRTRSGGFSRKANAAPFLDATWHGVAAILLLQGEFCPI